MNKLIYSIFAISAILFATFVSCEKSTEWNDNEAPSIAHVVVSKKDTLLVEKPSAEGAPKAYDTLYINVWGMDETHTETNVNQIDTIILGHMLTFSANFKDNKALSSYRIEIQPTTTTSAAKVDDEPETPTAPYRDTLLVLTRGYSLQNTDIKEEALDSTVSKQKIVLIPDTVLNITKRPVKEGDYRLIVDCMDKAGNSSTTWLPVRLLNRKTILKNIDK